MTWDKYKSAFGVFSDGTAAILKKYDYDDYEGTYKMRVIAKTDGDTQAYSGGLAQEEYGLNIECEKKFFCEDLPDDVKEGMYAILDGAGSLGTLEIGDITEIGSEDDPFNDGEVFIVQYIIRERLGATMLLKRTVL